MVSTWHSKYIVDSLSEDFEKHFANKTDTPLISHLKALIESLGKVETLHETLGRIVQAWDHLAIPEHTAEGQDTENVGLVAESLDRASRHLVLSGDWMTSGSEVRARLETAIRKCLQLGIGRKESLEAVVVMSAKPWDSSRMRNLLTGKSEMQKEVLALVSTEGVDTVLLRAELLVEAGLDKPAYRFVSNVVSSLLSEHIVFQSYVSTSSPGSLERLVDVCIALAAATHHLSRLYKILKLLGLEEVNKVYLQRFQNYASSPEDMSSLDKRLAVSPGRLQRLFTPVVCTRVIKIIDQWSIAGAGVKECPPEIQKRILKRWLGSVTKFQSVEADVETLMKTATQTSFLYNLGYILWEKFGKEVETMTLKMFIKGLNNDINNLEAFKKNKTKKAEVEKLLSQSFLRLSEIVSDRLSLAREAVLTGFSIVPTLEALDKIKKFAKISGFDKLAKENEDEESPEEVPTDNSDGSHCRITAGGKFSRVKPITDSSQAQVNSAEACLKSINQKHNFENIFDNFSVQLTGKSFGRAERKLRSKEIKKKKFRNLEGLLSIQGELITEASNYNPLDAPCKSLTPEMLNLSKEMTGDLLIVISAPRWHLLSWVMDWKELHQKCIKLLEDPSLRVPSDELKYLNIDYTQFDEWSSDEELTIFTGIEKGYEKWLEVENEDDKFSEHGLTSDDEEVVFNTKHTIDRLDYDDMGHFVTDTDYRLKDEGEETADMKRAAVWMVEDEITADEMETSDNNTSVEPEPEKQAAKTAEPMDVNYALVDPTPLPLAQLKARLSLARLVPGLEGSAVPADHRVLHQVMMVQISPGSSAANVTSVVSPTSGTVVLRPGPSGVTSVRPVGVTTVTRPGQTTIRLSPVTSPRLATPRLTTPNVTLASSSAPGSPAKKIQYICKQGGQTFLIESSAVLDKLRAGGGSVQLRLPVSAVRTVGNNTSTNTSVSLDTTNTLPPVSGKSDLTEGLAGRLGSLLPVSTVPAVTTNASLAIRQAAVVSAGLTNSTNKAPAPATSTIVVTKAPVVTDSPLVQEESQVKLESSNNNSPTDLIRQLNLARAQGLVVLQQWGDKQVLVHKATGRWIMRQGSRLVTVPPQALGITVTEGGAAVTTPGSSPAISSRTMEQLAEFDSILESKFKTQENGEIKNGSVVVVSGSGNTKQVIQLPTTPLKKELVLGTNKDGSLKSNTTSPIKSPPTLSVVNNATYPKPQEDPETMKRIQAILDDYNDQIRNSPDLHNRPAPRRRTNGSGNPDSDSPKPDSPRSSGSASGSTSPNTRRCGSESLSPSPSLSPAKSDPLTVAMAEIKESAALTLTAKPSTIVPSLTAAPATANVRLVPKVSGGLPVTAVGQRLVRPASSVQRLIVVSSADGRRMVAVRPVVGNTNNITNTISTANLNLNTKPPITVSLPTSPVSLSSLTSFISRPNSPPRPPTPDLGIPMEMTPGQIMEAEISATLLDDPESPFPEPGSLIGDDPDASLHDHVFSVTGSPGPSLDTEFDQVIQTSGQTSHLPSLVSSQLDLPVTVGAASPEPPSGATMNLLTSETTSILNTNTVRVSSKRRRSDRLEDTMPEPKIIRIDPTKLNS